MLSSHCYSTAPASCPQDKAVLKRVEAFVGEYASGKSEVSINRALALHHAGEKVTLADLDLVEPVYTLRPLKKELVKAGLDVVAWETHETIGLGEAGMTLHPEMKSLTRRSGVVVLDVGYGVYGSEILNVIEGLPEHPALLIYLVVNIMRPMTSSVEAIVDEASRFRKLDGLINNSHLGDETTPELVVRGASLVNEACQKLRQPFIATAAIEDIAQKVASESLHGSTIWPLKRYMPRAFW